MRYEMRRQQHRAYWRTQTGGKDYEVFPTEPGTGSDTSPPPTWSKPSTGD